jgi:hypothetical protein
MFLFPGRSEAQSARRDALHTGTVPDDEYMAIPRTVVHRPAVHSVRETPNIQKRQPAW